MTERPNHDPISELACLAACMWSKHAREQARKIVRGSDFYDPRHEAIWEAMGRLDREKGGFDPAGLSTAILASHRAAVDLLPTLADYPAIPEQATEHAHRVRGWAIRREVHAGAIRTTQEALNPEIDPQILPVRATNLFAGIRDRSDSEDSQSVTLSEVLTTPDADRDWVVGNLLERGDRFMLTGSEGGGKSYLFRQVALMAAWGLDPFDMAARCKPVSVLIVDCENSLSQIRRKVRPVAEFARKHGTQSPGHVNFLPTRRMNITSDRDLARVHREIDACQPDMVIIGPLYRLSPHAIQTDDEASPILSALDTIRDRGIALLLEAHAGHGSSIGAKVRDLRPRGSAALLGWPEFGYGMRVLADGSADLVPWRGDRDERDWPRKLRRSSDGIRWVPYYDPELDNAGTWAG